MSHQPMALAAETWSGFRFCQGPGKSSMFSAPSRRSDSRSGDAFGGGGWVGVDVVEETAVDELLGHDGFVTVGFR